MNPETRGIEIATDGQQHAGRAQGEAAGETDEGGKESKA
jgi:hypothetical protein